MQLEESGRYLAVVASESSEVRHHFLKPTQVPATAAIAETTIGPDPNRNDWLTILALLGFRLLWGFVGSRRSRFADFICSWGRVRAYTAELVDLAPPRHVGHNPLGGWMVVPGFE